MVSIPLSCPLRTAVLAATVLLTACGGGGSDSSAPAPAPVAAPGSGPYVWLQKVQGTTASSTSLPYVGLSLIHRSDPTTEWVVESPGDVISDATVVSSGTPVAADQSVTGLSPATLVYIMGGDVRRVPLQANGQAPRGQVQRAGTSSACRFMVKAVDHRTPDNSRFIVSTAGADGVCGTPDDGAAEVRLSSGAPGIVLQTLTGAVPMAVVRDPATLAPRAWVGPNATTPWGPGELPLTFRTASNQLTRVLASSARSVLAESTTGLAILDFAGGGVFTDTPVAGVGVNGWQLIGFDAGFFYAWRNSGGTGGSWQVLRMAPGVPNPAPLSSGIGELVAAGLGRDQIYLTVAGAGGTQLLRVPKAVTGAPPVLIDTAAPGGTLIALTSGGAGVHLIGSRAATGAFGLRVVDELGSTLHTSSAAAGSLPLLLGDDSTLRLNASENTNRFIFVDGFGSRGFADNRLQAWDIAGRRLIALGTLPGAADFGANAAALANVFSAGSGSAMAGFSAAPSGGIYDPSRARAWSFDAAASDSLVLTTRSQP